MFKHLILEIFKMFLILLCQFFIQNFPFLMQWKGEVFIVKVMVSYGFRRLYVLFFLSAQSSMGIMIKGQPQHLNFKDVFFGNDLSKKEFTLLIHIRYFDPNNLDLIKIIYFSVYRLELLVTTVT